MKAYLWHGIESVSDNYHERGSVLIEASSIERARELAVIPEFVPMKGVEREPDRIFESDSTEEKVWVFPDAGCC